MSFERVVNLLLPREHSVLPLSFVSLAVFHCAFHLCAVHKKLISVLLLEFVCHTSLTRRITRFSVGNGASDVDLGLDGGGNPPTLTAVCRGDSDDRVVSCQGHVTMR